MASSTRSRGTRRPRRDGPGAPLTMTVRPRELALLRLAAQGLLDPQPVDVADAVRAMVAMQGQDFPGVLTSIALRSGGTRADVVAAFDRGQIVRSWPMRGTLHVVAAEDLALILGLTADRTLAGAAKRREQLGLDDALLAHTREVTERALAGGGRLVRDELRAVWEQAGLPADGPHTYHQLWWLAHRGVVCFGPVRGKEQEIVLSSEWIGVPPERDRDEALGELALRYFRSHGPATVKDFLWWTKLPAGEARAGTAMAAHHLDAVEVDGVEYLMDPGTPDRLAAAKSAARGVLLLPGFDEFLLGYQQRDAALPAEFAQRIVPGNNGVFRPTVVAAGQVVGTWRQAGSGSRRRLDIDAFTPLTATVEQRAQARFARLP